MTYSANNTGYSHYGVGYATAKHPLGPWLKADENPILTTDLSKGVSSPGHNSIVASPDGSEMFIVYHRQDRRSTGWFVSTGFLSTGRVG